jgi:hypothetical protein
MPNSKIAFLSHKAKDVELAKIVKKAILRVIPIQVFISEEIRKAEDFRHEIIATLDRADCFVFIFTDPSDDWSWCFYEVGFYDRFAAQASGLRRPIYCLHLPDTLPPSPLAHLQAIKAQTEDIERWLLDLCGVLKPRSQTPEKLRLAAKKIEEGFKTLNIVSETDIKPYIWVIPAWPRRSEANFNAAELPSIRFEKAIVTIDRDSAKMLGFGTPPQNYTLEQFLKILNYDSPAGNRRPPWMTTFFDSLQKGVSADLKMQELAFFRHEEGTVLRPLVVSVAKNKEATTCKLKVRFLRTVAPPPMDQSDPVQRLADGVRLGVRTQIEVIEAFSGRMSQIYRDKVLSESPIDEVGRNFSVGSRMITALQAIRDEATAHGFKPKGQSPRLFDRQAEQKRYEEIRDEGNRLWAEIEKVAEAEDSEARGKYVRTEKLLCELKKLNHEYLEVALPRLGSLLRLRR